MLLGGLVVLAVVMIARFWGRRRPPEPPPEPGSSEPGYRAPVPTFRVVALGASGSGKTVLLASMFHELNHVTRTRSYALETNPQDRLLLANIQQQVSDPARPWPRGTGRSLAETREFVFDCVARDEQGHRRTVATVSYLDFAGALLEDAEHATSESFARLHDAIGNASALLVLIDGRRVRQLLADEPAGHRHFVLTMGPLLGFAQQAECPLHFVITKWDLLQDVPALAHLDEPARLDHVVAALMRHPQISALVYAAGPRQIVRMIPVSSVGPAFVALDDAGHVQKRSDGTVRPTNIEAPLAAVVPDVFRQIEASLTADTRRTLNSALRDRLNSGIRGLARRFTAVVSGPVGIAVQTAVGSYLGPVGDGMAALFIDWAGRRNAATPPAVAQFRDQADREVAAVRALRTRVLDDFARTLYLLEDHYPGSLLRSGHWTGPA